MTSYDKERLCSGICIGACFVGVIICMILAGLSTHGALKIFFGLCSFPAFIAPMTFLAWHSTMMSIKRERKNNTMQATAQTLKAQYFPEKKTVVNQVSKLSEFDSLIEKIRFLFDGMDNPQLRKEGLNALIWAAGQESVDFHGRTREALLLLGETAKAYRLDACKNNFDNLQSALYLLQELQAESKRKKFSLDEAAGDVVEDQIDTELKALKIALKRDGLLGEDQLIKEEEETMA